MNKAEFLSDFEKRLSMASLGSTVPLDREIYTALGGAVMAQIADDWAVQTAARNRSKRCAWLSANYLVGPPLRKNLLALGLLEDTQRFLQEKGLDFSTLEHLTEPALGIGVPGRFSACVLDSAATMQLPVDSYGIRYRYGMFRQKLREGRQQEEADDWRPDTDPWLIPRESDAVEVHFARQQVLAVPWDMPIIGQNGYIGRLRLWQARPLLPFDYARYRREGFSKATVEYDAAGEIDALINPDDRARSGKLLRLKQEYFFSNASLQDMMRDYVRNHGTDFSLFPDFYAIHLSGSQPIVAIPDMLRILVTRYGYDFEDAFSIVSRTFACTSHAVAPEALEYWNTALFRSVSPETYDIVRLIDNRLAKELVEMGVDKRQSQNCRIIHSGRVYMARLASYVCGHIIGVSARQTQLLRQIVLPNWNRLYPQRFICIPSGISPRQWLNVCNPELSTLITELLNGNHWLSDFSQIKQLEKFAGDDNVIRRFASIKQHNKQRFARWLHQRCGASIDPTMLCDLQIAHFYDGQRQVMNALSILDLYLGIKDGKLTNFPPTLFVFAGKASPSNVYAKSVIQLVTSLSRLISADPSVRQRIQVVMVPDCNISVAERLLPACELAELLGAPGMESANTAAMKLSINGAAMISGTGWDEVSTNYSFTLPEPEPQPGGGTAPLLLQESPKLQRLLGSLTDGTFGPVTSTFTSLRDTILEDISSGDEALLASFLSYLEVRQSAIMDYNKGLDFFRIGFLNLAASHTFSMDQTLLRYADQIWDMKLA